MSMKPGFDTLQSHAARLQGAHSSSLLAKDPARARDFALRQESLYFNFARQSYDRDALDALLALARSPQPTEVQAALAFVKTQHDLYGAAADGETKAWADFCQMLLASNSFLYVE